LQNLEIVSPQRNAKYAKTRFFALLAFFAAIHLHSIPLLSNFGFRTSDLSQRRGWKQLEAALALIVLPEAGDGVSLPEVWRDG
jgi:hypothetical protein